MPTYDKNNPLTFPVRIFTNAVFSRDVNGNEVHTAGVLVPGAKAGEYVIDTSKDSFVEFYRLASEPKPVSLEDAKAILRERVKKDATLRGIVDKALPDADGDTKKDALMATVREVLASPKATVAMKATIKDRAGKSVRLDTAQEVATPVVLVKSDFGGPTVLVEKPVDPIAKEPIK